jgi:ABC-type branched-subunit amino acid transport system permease subunit
VSVILNLGFWSFVLVMAGIYTIFALGLHLQIGFTGISNLGHVAFMAIGAYTMAILVIRTGMPLWLASLAGIALAMLASTALGLATLKLRAEYMAISTLAFAEIVRYLAMNMSWLTGGVQGSTNILGIGQTTRYNDSWQVFIAEFQSRLGALVGAAVSRDIAMLVVIWSTALLLILMMQRLVRSPWGRALKAIREDPESAEAMGKNVLALRLQSMALGSALGAVAGLFHAFHFSFFQPLDFETLISFYAFIIIILGGIGHNWGVPAGALIFGFIFAGTRLLDVWPLNLLTSAERAYVRFIIIGSILIWLVMYRPQGIFGKREEMVLE